MRAALIAMSTSAALAIACSDPNVPEDVACDEIFEVANLGLADALASAGAGDCVLLPDGSFNGPILLPAGVTLVAEVGASANLSGGVPAVVRASEGSAIVGVAITSGPAHGILIDAASFTAARTQVFDVVDAAVGIRCEDPGCLRGEISLDAVEIRRAGSGLVVLGANTIVRGGVIADVVSTGLAGGGAIYVANGGALDLEGTEIATSDYGVVADRSVVSLRNATIRDCAASGVWGQKLNGSASARSLTIEGTAITGHAGVGVALLESSGVSIANGSITGTSRRTTVFPDGTNGEIGDGLLVLAGSAEISIESIALRDNARAQAIVDDAGANVVFGANSVDATNGEWEVVVQNSGATVTVPAQDLSTAPVLRVPLSEVLVPSVGP